MIFNGDSMEVLKTLDENSVDSIVTDPPYGLSFMGKAWDHSVPSAELWKEALRVLKPGGYILAFAGTRTQHRMAVNIEDAGFEIRDMIAWVYGSGFPKSHNIGKAVGKIQGHDKPSTYTPNNKNKVYSNNYGGGVMDTTPADNEYNGWGTALKPALEPITVARKPFKGNVANNVLEWGTGGINIDGSRIPTTDKTGREVYQTQSWKNTSTAGVGSVNDDWKQGRFPANLIHDGSDEVVGLFPDSKGQQGNVKGTEPSSSTNGIYRDFAGRPPAEKRNDSGSAARFFYCAKAGKAERNKGLEGFEERIVNDGRETSIDNAYQRGDSLRANTHPTVKPVRLMQYLVKLVTPVGGIVLDPFNGSGTTGIACKLEGFEYIGIELDPEYCTLSEARIEAWQPELKVEQTSIL